MERRPHEVGLQRVDGAQQVSIEIGDGDLETLGAQRFREPAARSDGHLTLVREATCEDEDRGHDTSGEGRRTRRAPERVESSYGPKVSSSSCSRSTTVAKRRTPSWIRSEVG